MLINECTNELVNHILPFWNKLRDDENGGFYGQMDNDHNVDKKGTKGVILNSRILWFYSECCRVLGKHRPDIYEDMKDKLLGNARHAYEFLRDRCVDRENGGVYWLMNYDGTVNDSMKHTYNQAFAIYALSTYYLVTKDEEALKLAFTLFDTVEEKCTDDIAYMEAFDRNWQIIENDALSENGLMADKTMNTVLHLIEGYTVLFKASGDERVKARLKFLLDITETKIFDSENNKLLVFFDRELNVIGDIHSYGHDIEATWLIDRACEVLGDKEYIDKWRSINLRISNNIYSIALENGALNNERENDKIDRKRVWWVQAETIVGFINAFEQSTRGLTEQMPLGIEELKAKVQALKDGGQEKFINAIHDVWNWIKTYQIDKRDGGEWWAEVDFEGKPMPKVTMVNEWKCPYHNGRMCLEVISRGVDVS
ncbi:MAG: AGE family epimerase/isomerase [Oscillospiraceae bacterium]|nr:AGE family epimerase/isomerase [Oscillospiraceae bacterium]